MKRRKKRVSIIIPSYRPCYFLTKTVRSVLDNSHGNLEIIVVDDGSPNRYRKLLQRLPVTLVPLEKNQGIAAALNAGITRSGGDFVTFIDQDDLLCSHGIDWRLNWLRKHPSFPIVMGCTDAIINSRDLIQPYLTRRVQKRFEMLPHLLKWSYFESGGWVPLSPLSLCLMHRSLLEEMGPLDESLNTAHDLELLYRILNRGVIPFYNIPVLRYRVHGQNHSLSRIENQLIPSARNVAERWIVNTLHGVAM